VRKSISLAAKRSYVDCLRLSKGLQKERKQATRACVGLKRAKAFFPSKKKNSSFIALAPIKYSLGDTTTEEELKEPKTNKREGINNNQTSGKKRKKRSKK
jgi:hypothetical protein